MVDSRLVYAAKIAKAGGKHLAYLEAIAQDLDSKHNEMTAKAQYRWAVGKMDEHKKTCTGCTKGTLELRLAELTDPAALKERADRLKSEIHGKEG